MTLDPETRTALARAVQYISSDRYLANYYHVSVDDVVRARRLNQPKRQGRPTKLLDHAPIGLTDAASYEEMDSRVGCQRLREATMALFRREGRKVGLTPEGYGAMVMNFAVTPERIAWVKERGL